MSFTSLVSVHLPTVIAVINQDPSLSTLEHFSSSSEPVNSSDAQKKEMTKKLVDYNKKHPIMFFLYLILNPRPLKLLHCIFNVHVRAT